MTHPNVLKQFPLLNNFPIELLQRIAGKVEQLTVDANQPIIEVGEQSQHMYLILVGKVRIHRTNHDGNMIELTLLEAGQTFGELALFTNEPRMATATALTPCKLLIITRPVLEEAFQNAPPKLFFDLLRMISAQMRNIHEANFQSMLQQQTLEAQMEAERQRSLTQMVAGVAHEINTPLGVVSTAVSIIERQLKNLTTDPARATEDITEAVDLMKRSIQRAHRLVQDFKKVSVSQLSDVKETMNLVEAVQEINDLAAIQLKRSGITIQFTHTLPQDQQTWLGYRGYLSQVILNLLTNIERYAYDAGKGGIAAVTLAIEDESHFRLSVRDEGNGIPPENLVQIFDPFFTTGRNIGGTGLGMMIVHNLVTDALKGSIKIQSEVGKGTDVIVIFPRQVPD